MLSGNGRHRRPRQAPALFVAAGVTGSAIAIPLLGASGASAADGGTWDRVATCETGGAWSADSGDGAYGGLNITLEDWERYGGLDFAERPDLASRSQQIAVAEKILADRGAGVWGTCGASNGLTSDTDSAEVDTGVESGTPSTGAGGSGGGSSSGAATPGASESDGSGKTSGLPSSSASSDPADDASGAPSSKPSTSDKSRGKGASTPTPGNTQAPDSSPIEPDESDIDDNSWRVGGFSSLVDTGALARAAKSADVGASESAVRSDGSASFVPQGTGRHRGASADEGLYTVRSGDSLASIADSLDVDGGWSALYAANRDVVGGDPSAIVPGQTLSLPGE